MFFVFFTFRDFIFMLKNDMSEFSVLISIVPSIRSRRAVPDGGPHVSAAYDLTSFMRFFGFDEKLSKSLSMRLSLAPSIRSRRAVSDDGPLLSVGYVLTCFMCFFWF